MVITKIGQRYSFFLTLATVTINVSNKKIKTIPSHKEIALILYRAQMRLLPLLWQDLYADGLTTSLILLNLVLNTLAFGQSLEALGHDTRIVNKYFTSILEKDKSVTLLAVEPFNLANHCSML